MTTVSLELCLPLFVQFIWSILPSSSLLHSRPHSHMDFVSTCAFNLSLFFIFFPLTGMSQHNTFCIHALLQKEILQKLVQFVSISDKNSEKFSKFLHKETAVGIVCILIAFSFNFYLMHQGEVCVIHRMRNLENSSEASFKYLLHLLLFIE